MRLDFIRQTTTTLLSFDIKCSTRDLLCDVNYFTWWT